MSTSFNDQRADFMRSLDPTLKGAVRLLKTIGRVYDVVPFTVAQAPSGYSIALCLLKFHAEGRLSLVSGDNSIQVATQFQTLVNEEAFGGGPLRAFAALFGLCSPSTIALDCPILAERRTDGPTQLDLRVWPLKSLL